MKLPATSQTAMTILLILLVGGTAFADSPATMRLDYYHTGNHEMEVFSLDQVVLEPLPLDRQHASAHRQDITWQVPVRDRRLRTAATLPGPEASAVSTENGKRSAKPE